MNNLNTKTSNKRNKKKQNKNAVLRSYHIYSIKLPVKRLDDALQLPYTSFPRVYAMICMFLKFCYFLFPIIIFVKKNATT